MTKTAVLLVSFGTTYPKSRHETDDAVNKVFQAKFPEATMFHAYTSKIVRHRVAEQEQVVLDDVTMALQKIADQGFDHLVVQSLHVMPGIEYSRMMEKLTGFDGHFDQLSVGQPLLSTFNDFQTVVTWLTAEGDKHPDQTVLFMGHGTENAAFTTYACLDHMLMESNVFMGAVESYPDIQQMIHELDLRGQKNVIVRPFMMVAGNHVHHDMVSEAPTSWSSQLTQAGYTVTPDLDSLATSSVVLNLFADHAKQAEEAKHDN